MKQFNLTPEQAEEFAKTLGKMDEAEASRVHFLLVRGAEPETVSDLLTRGRLFEVHWSYLIKDFDGVTRA